MNYIEKEKQYPFTITIDDKYSKYEYIFFLSDEISIYDIVTVIANHYKVSPPKGKYVE